MTIKVIGFPLSGPTLRVIAALKELGIPFEFNQIKGFEETKTEEYLSGKNPFGKIPVLIDDGFTLYESYAIARYLAVKYQGKHNNAILFPNDAQKAAIIDQHITAEGFYYDAPITAVLFEKAFNKHFFGKEADLEVVKKELENLSKTLDVYDKILEGKEYLTGSDISLADVLHYPATVYANVLGHGDLWESRPNVKRWFDNLSKRESYKDVKKYIDDNFKN